MGEPFRYCTGPVQALGAKGPGFPASLLATFHRRRQDVPSHFLVCRAFPTEIFHERRMKVGSPGTPETSILDVTHLAPYSSHILNGYLSPFLDKDNERKQRPAPLFAPSMRCWTHHRSPGHLVPCCSTDNRNHKYSIPHTHHARVMPPGSQVVSPVIIWSFLIGSSA